MTPELAACAALILAGAAIATFGWLLGRGMRYADGGLA